MNSTIALSSVGRRYVLAGSSDYIFKGDGLGNLEFVANFDGLYRDVADPWEQSAVEGAFVDYYVASRSRLLWSLRNHMKGVDDFSGLEVGCGLGYVTEILGAGWEGMDVSPVAIARARELFPNITFHIGDITAKDALVGYNAQYSVVVLGQVWWYILHALQDAVDNCARLLRPGGLLVVSQAFLREQRYGTDVVHGFNGALDWFLDREVEWQIVEAYYEDKRPGPHQDGLIILRKL